MSLRLEMLQVARLAPNLLGESSSLVEEFIITQIHLDGGFKDRAGKSDLYYTVFGLESLLALQSQFDRAKIVPFLQSFGAGAELDFVHLTCLARAWASIPDLHLSGTDKREILARLETFRTEDGGYNPTPDARHGTAYACFLGLGAYQDLEIQLPEPHLMGNCLAALQSRDGAFANAPNMPLGLTSPTAAAVILLRQLNQPPDQRVGPWLLARCHPQGGFCAIPQAPMPDLLSTATALHALAGLQISFEHIREACLDFIDTLWVNSGAFYGNWGDDALDCEYTYYGLLALGHLSL